jgi:hypothetical protein
MGLKAPLAPPTGLCITKRGMRRPFNPAKRRPRPSPVRTIAPCEATTRRSSLIDSPVSSSQTPSSDLGGPTSHAYRHKSKPGTLV